MQKQRRAKRKNPLKICKAKLKYADLIKRAVPGCQGGFLISQIHLNFYLNLKNHDKQRQTKKEGKSAGNIGFYIAISRDKQRQNTVLSFPDNENLRQINPAFMRVCGTSNLSWQQTDNNFSYKYEGLRRRMNSWKANTQCSTCCWENTFWKKFQKVFFFR